jgi:LysR family transcriptional regulator, glycine cleavage system transcriptional activator
MVIDAQGGPVGGAVAALHLLPAFELTARHLSIKRAARELHLTPSAVSQQIRALEEALGLKLFRRLPRALELSEAGHQFAAVVRETLESYRRGSERVLRQHARRILSLSADPFVAHEVLIPQLHTFGEQADGGVLQIQTSEALVDFERDSVDAAVRYGRAPWPGLVATPLCDAFATPVCAPGLVHGDSLPAPAALARYPLIVLRGHPDPWQRAAQRLGFELTREPLVFDSYFASLRAAEKGLGIAMGVFPTTTSAVLEGRLVMPLALRIRTHAKFHFVCRKEDAELPAFAALRSWTAARFASLKPIPGSAPMLDEP